MNAAVDRYRQACDAWHESVTDEDIQAAVHDSWEALPLRTRLREMLTPPCSAAAGEIRQAARQRGRRLLGCRWAAYCYATAEAEAREPEHCGHIEDDPECAWTSVQPAWDALPLWLRVAMCLRCHWIDAVYEAHPPLGRWLVERRAARRGER